MAQQRWRITLEVLVDKEALAAHDGDASPPPNKVEEWYGGDLERAIEMGLAEIEHDEVVAELLGEED